MAANFPYMTNPAALKKFLVEAPAMGVPEKVTLAYLKGAGFTSTNDRPIVPALKFLGLVGSDGVPTAVWR